MGPILLQIRTPPLSRFIYCCKILGSGLIIQLIKDTHKQQTYIFTNLINAMNLEASGIRQNPTSFWFAFDFIVESNSCNNYTLDSRIKNKNIFYSLLLLLLLLLSRKEGFILIEEEQYYNHQNPYINLTIHILVFLKKVVSFQMSLLFGLMFSGIGCLCQICNLHLA